MKQYLFILLLMSSWAFATDEIHEAAAKGDVGRVGDLIKKGVNVDWGTSKPILAYLQTPLHKAAQGCHYDVVHLLLQTGVRVDPEDSEGKTPLMYAALHCSNVNIAKLLLRYGAHVNHKDKRYDTPLLYATYGCNWHTMKIFKAYGADTKELHILDSEDANTPLSRAKRDCKNQSSLFALYWKYFEKK